MMNPIALVIVFAVGLLAGWKTAGLLLAGYLMAWFIIGLLQGWSRRP